MRIAICDDAASWNRHASKVLTVKPRTGKIDLSGSNPLYKLLWIVYY